MYTQSLKSRISFQGFLICFFSCYFVSKKIICGVCPPEGQAPFWALRRLYTENLRSKELTLLIHFSFKMLNFLYFLVFLLVSNAMNVSYYLCGLNHREDFPVGCNCYCLKYRIFGDSSECYIPMTYKHRPQYDHSGMFETHSEHFTLESKSSQVYLCGYHSMQYH